MTKTRCLTATHHRWPDTPEQVAECCRNRWADPPEYAITIVTMIASFALLSLAMKTLPLGTAYTIWTGIGAVGAFVVGIAVLGEAITPARIIAVLLIVSGILTMKLASA